MSARRRILVLNQYAPPDVASTGQIALEVALALGRAGHSVTFIAAQPSYGSQPIAAPARERLEDGVSIRRLWIGGVRGRGRLARRIGGYLLYLVRAAVAGLRLARGGAIDVVLCFHNPPLLGAIGAVVARPGGSRFVYVVQDIHPDILTASGWLALPRGLRAVWNLANRLILAAATKVVVPGEGMRRVLVADKGVAAAKVVVIPVWAQPELTPQPPDPEVRARVGADGDQLLVLHTGNMGVMQDVEPVVAAARALAGQPVRFVFVGEGAQAQRWRAAMAGLANVEFLPFQTAEAYARLVAACDAGLVTLADGMERLAVASRAFPYLAAGRPLLTVMNPGAEVAQLVERERCGFNATTAAGLEAALARCLEDRHILPAAGARARAAYLAGYRREVLCRAYVDLCA